jgi:hypothetical protein
MSFGLVTTGVRPQVKQRVTSPPPPIPPLALTLALAPEDAEDDV